MFDRDIEKYFLSKISQLVEDNNQIELFCLIFCKIDFFNKENLEHLKNKLNIDLLNPLFLKSKKRKEYVMLRDNLKQYRKEIGKNDNKKMTTILSK